ncbi:hypothetical protein ACFL4S_01725, partial [bacterium]
MYYVFVSGMIMFVCGLLCSFAIYFKGLKDKLNFRWAMVCITIGLWGQAISMLFTTSQPGEALLLYKFIIIADVLAILFFSLFIKKYLEIKNSRTYDGSYHLIILLVLILSIFYSKGFVKDLGLNPRF